MMMKNETMGAAVLTPASKTNAAATAVANGGEPLSNSEKIEQVMFANSPYISISHTRFLRCENSGEGDGEESWLYVNSPAYEVLTLSRSQNERLHAAVHINKSRINLSRRRLLQAELLLYQGTEESNSEEVVITVGDVAYGHRYDEEWNLDITDLYSAASDELTLPLALVSEESFRSFSTVILKLTYELLGSRAEKKSFVLGGGVSSEAEILYGTGTVTLETIRDPVLGVSVCHIHKPGEDGAYGNGYRLNLDEQLEKTADAERGSYYLYTDAYGESHTFDEHYYTVDTAGEKAYIREGLEAVSADADGRLWLDGVEVFRELVAEGGLRATARLDDTVNNTEWVEERLSEEKELEERLVAYENAFRDFMTVKKENGKVVSHFTMSHLSSPDAVEAFLLEAQQSANILLPEAEILAYRNALAQRDSLSVTVEALDLQSKAVVQQREALALQLESIENNVRELMRQYNDTANPLSEDDKALIESQVRNFVLDGTKLFAGDADGILTKSYQNIQAQLELAEEQGVNIQAQLEAAETQLANAGTQVGEYTLRSYDYIDQCEDYYKEYLALKKQYERMKIMLPVCFLHAEGSVKGFNAAGELVLWQDSHGHELSFERESRPGMTGTRITGIIDREERRMRFVYNGENRLSEIENSVGECTRFSYTVYGELHEVKRTRNPSLTLSYIHVSQKEQISHVAFSDGTAAQLLHMPDGRWKSLYVYSRANEIAHDAVTEGGSAILSKVDIAYTDTATVFTYDGKKGERYEIDPTAERVTARYELVDDKVTGAEQYTYTAHLVSGVVTAHESCLGQHSYGAFPAHMVVGGTESIVYNSFDDPVSVEACHYTEEGTLREKTLTGYTYDGSRRPIALRTTHTVWAPAHPEQFVTTVGVEKYSYNTTGELVRRESYVEGEELKTGVNVEEHIYNDKGIEVQSFAYNSLDPSSKLYTEQEVDGDGRVLASFDGGGEHKTAFDYERDGVGVKTERLPNGSKISYAREKDGTVSAITHSTEGGEENSTTRLRTLDMVTKITSGNNTVCYTYDEKRRVKTVSLNGVEPYVTYHYTGEHTHAETVAATLADGTVATTTKNLYGNVTVAAVGDRNVNNTYDAEQRLTKVVDSVSGETVLSYDNDGNLTGVTAPEHSETFTYDPLYPDLLTQKTVTVGNVSRTYQYTYRPTSDKAPASIAVSGVTVKPHIDALGRNVGKTVEMGASKIAEEKISYIKYGDRAMGLPSTVRYAKGGVFCDTLQYRYDSMGNIAEVSENGRCVCRYEYDALGRLTREDNAAFGKTTTWAYDNNGNILAKYEYAITAKPTGELHLLDCSVKRYAYDDNSDQLLSYGDEAFVYDSIGNPTTYRGKTAVWEYARQLKSYNGTTFSYDARGRRIAKNGITFTYDAGGNLVTQSNGLEFLYDHTGIFAVKHNGSTYFYRKDAQANIVALLDSTGTVMVKYVYDAWGKCKVLDAAGTEMTDNTHIGILNPFRYRSYYYDTETNLYFLKTRYYDPAIGRFMTIDDLSYLDSDSINGLNLYAYCLNNPTNYVDPTGNAPWWSWLISGLQLAGGIALCFVPGAQAIGVSMIIGGSLGLIANAVSPAISQAIGGASSMANGWGAISTGISLLSFGTPGIIAGIGLMLVGGATMAFGANEIVSAATGINYIQQWTGISDSAYGWTYFGLNVASSVGTIAGRWGMRIAATTNLRSSPSTAKPYGKNVWKNNEYHYNGRGKPYWSRHNIDMINDGTPNGFHLHVGFGRDGEHIYNYVHLIMKLIFKR